MLRLGGPVRQSYAAAGRHRQAVTLGSAALFDAVISSVTATEPRRFAHKFAAPECSNLLKLRAAIEQNFQPICFYVKNDYAMGHHVYDQHFCGILCSPAFEGKTYRQINAMVDRILEPIGLKGRVKLHCQPPSRFEASMRCISEHAPTSPLALATGEVSKSPAKAHAPARAIIRPARG